VADPSANLEEQKRDFYKACVDPKFDLKAVLVDTDREEFLDRSHYEVHLLSLHATSNLSKCKTMLYFLFILALPMNRSIAQLFYFIGAFINVFGIRKRQLSWLQHMLADEDAFTLFCLFFMRLCSPKIQLVYLSALVMWAGLNIAEHCYTQKILTVMKPMFEWLILNEVEIVKLKATIEITTTFFSPLLLFPLGLCAPLLPLIGLQVVRLKYVISEFAKNTFRLYDTGFKMVPFGQRFIEGTVKPWLQ
jgi:hypothetical protein